MLAQGAEPFDSDQHVFEIKWDGTRCMVYVQQDRSLTLINRREFELLDRYPELQVLSRLPPGTILDGEIIVLEGGRPNFRKLMQREQQRSREKIAMLAPFTPATLVAFDAPFVGGQCWMKRPLIERTAELRRLVTELASPHVIAIEGVIGAGKAFFEKIEKEGMEGLIAKRLQSSYQPGVRSPDWLKLKVATTDDFAVVGFTPGTVKGMLGALIIGHRRGAGGGGTAWDYKGKVGSGFTDDERVQLLTALEQMPELERRPRGAGLPTDAVWRSTGLWCRVRYFEKTHTGMLRAPVFKGFVEPRR